MSRRRKFLSGILALLGLALLSSCSSESVPTFGFDRGVSSVNDHALPVWQIFWVLAVIVGIFTAGLIFWSIAFHRRKGNEMPKQTQYNVPTEIAYTLIPIVLVAILFAFTARAETAITKVSPASATNVHDITVNGIQWSWQFTYENLGPETAVTGTPSQPPVLYLPVGERVRFELTSSDVNHSFWIPAFMMKMDNLAGVTNRFEVTPTKEGTYPGRCAELCGRNHSLMLFTVKVVSPSEYQQQISKLKGAMA